MGMLSHSPNLRDGKGSTLSKGIQEYWHVRSTTPKSTVFRTRFLGTKGIVLIFLERSWQGYAITVSYLPVPPGVVSRQSIRSARESALLTIVGPGYRSDTVFNLAKMQPYTLTDLLGSFRHLTEAVALYLPRTSDVRQLANESIAGSKTTVVHYCVEGASKVGCF